MVCTADCSADYTCGAINQPPAGAIYAPYVTISFGDRTVTVGNASAPPENSAAITSFSYGFGAGPSGWGADFEILDTGGVLYEDIIKAVNKTITLEDEDVFESTFEFGWIVTSCNGSVPQVIKSGELHGIILKVESTHESGHVKLKMRVSAPTAKISETRHNNVCGDDRENKMHFKEALEKLFRENDPKFKAVKLLDKDGEEMEFKASDAGSPDVKLGPKSAWPMNQLNSLAIARNWWNSVTTKNGLGVVILYDPTDGSIIFQEDKLSEPSCACEHTMGTYVVNGGNCSPVLGFTPVVTWPKGLIPGSGATPGGAFSGNNDTEGVNPSNAPTGVKPTIEIEKAGSQSSPTVQQQDLNWRSPDDLAPKSSNALAAQLETNAKFEQALGFEAELKIIGDPKYKDGPSLYGKNVSIVYINPFHLKNCRWITTSNCNNTLSNKNYIIKEVSHQISGGSYITTLKLYLPTPNLTIPADDPLGSCGNVTFDEDPGASEATNANESEG